MDALVLGVCSERICKNLSNTLSHIIDRGCTLAFRLAILRSRLSTTFEARSVALTRAAIASTRNVLRLTLSRSAISTAFRCKLLGSLRATLPLYPSLIEGGGIGLRR